MSRKTMVRTITSTTIESANVLIKEGKPVMTANAPLIETGTVDADKALKLVRKKYGQTAIVTEVKQENAVYEMSVEDFIKLAKKVETPTPEQVQEGKTE